LREILSGGKHGRWVGENGKDPPGFGGGKEKNPTVKSQSVDD